jgi:hypothetical protein
MYTVVFSVNLERLTTEKVGPNTNQQTPTVLPPQAYCTVDTLTNAAADLTQQDTLRVSWLPGFLAGENVSHVDGYTFTAYGQKAAYLKSTYTSGDNAWLTVVSEA